MKYQLQKGGVVSLNQGNFKASGGEGSIYIIGDSAYKVYADPKKMIPFGKIRELQALNLPYIISPRDVLLDKKGSPVGYEMAAVPKSFTLAETFSAAFRRREGLSHDQVFGLVKKIRDGVKHAHEKDVLIVDMNELNFLVDPSFKEVFFIDCDSYQTRSFPATAIMENIRDPKVVNNQFSELSDWFSFAVLTFQMMTSISPYRGRHPKVKSPVERKKLQLSVFNPDVRIPRAAFPLDIIPEQWRAWYKAVLEDGQRLLPPGSDLGVVIIKPSIKVLPRGSTTFNVTSILEHDQELLDGWALYSDRIYRTNQGFVLNGRPIHFSGDLSGAQITLTRRTSHPVALVPGNREVRLKNLTTGYEGSAPMLAEQISSIDGRVYIKVGQQVMEVTASETAGGATILSSTVACNVLPKASRLFSGCVIQDLVGSCYVSMFPKSGITHQVHIPELEGYKIIDAKFSKQVLVVMANKGGKYNRFVFRMDSRYEKYDIRKVENVPMSPVNFVCLDSGVCVLVNEAEDLELFSNKKDSQNVKVVQDNFISGDMKLMTDGGSMIYLRGKKSAQLKMK
jgi:dUTPase